MKTGFRHFVIPAVAATLATGCAAAVGEPDYGVVAAPPLPVEVPVLEFDPSRDIADLDGSRIVSAASGQLRLSSAEFVMPVTLPIDREAEVRAVSADGTLAALFLRRDDDTSEVTVIDFGLGEPQLETFDLPGLVEPEAFSTDGRLLYVIDHGDRENSGGDNGVGDERVGPVPGSYRVRPLNLETGQLEQILGPSKVPFADDMNGTGRRQVWAPDGSRIYTLYIRQTHHHHEDGHAGGHGEPGTDGFVHILDLEEEWAFCLDLPEEFGDGDLETTALAVARDGLTLAVADLNAGQVAYGSTVDLAITDTHVLPPMEIDGTLQLGLTSDHLALAWNSELLWLHRDTLAIEGTVANVGAPLVGLTASGDNSLLAWTSAPNPRTLAAPILPSAD